MAAIALTVAQGVFFADRVALRAHMQGAYSIVSSLGGLTRISGGYVVVFRDVAYSAALMDAEPMDQFEEESLPIPAPFPLAQTQGQKFRDLTSVLDEELYLVCIHTCQLTELLEAHSLAFADGSPPASSGWTYFQYLRDNMSSRLARLYIKYRHTNTIDECIGLAINLYQLLVLRVTAYRLPLMRLCARIQVILLKSSDPQNYTFDCPTYLKKTVSRDNCSIVLRSAFLWILFITSAALQQLGYSSQEWVLNLIMKTLGVIYDESFRCKIEEWQTSQLRLLKQFCWSEVFLMEEYKMTCAMLRTHANTAKV